MAVIKYRASDGSIKTVPLIGQSGVTSINGKSGAITGMYGIDNPPPYPVTSVNGKTGAVTGLYDVNNPPPYPVTSVNGLTGNVSVHDYYYRSYGTTGKITIGVHTLLTVTIAVANNFTVGSGTSNHINIASWTHDSIIGIGASLRASNYGLCGISLVTTNNGASVLFNNQNSYDVGPTEFIVTLYNFDQTPVEITFN